MREEKDKMKRATFTGERLLEIKTGKIHIIEEVAKKIETIASPTR